MKGHYMNIGELIGVGYTADVYEWEKDKVLKLFYKDYSKEAIKKEYNNALAIREMDFLKPKAYDIISYDERRGIIYDNVRGESLLDWVMKSGDVQQCALYMSKLHKEIIKNEIHDVPNYKEFLRDNIPDILSPDEQNELLQRIGRLEEGSTLCHGDFHPGNILISKGQLYVIDFMNVCHGNYLYDIARTVFLVEYTPVPPEADNRGEIMQFKKALADMYLEQMNVTREMIQEYLSIIIIVRKGECPNE